MTLTAKSIIKISSTIVIVVAIAGYGLYQARNLIRGPQISLSAPYNGQSFTDPLITIAGTAANISYISLNDRQIFIDQTGHFYDKLLLPEGYTIMKLAARDKFGRTVTKLLELTYATSSESH
jgi:hypothetical protein